MSNKGFTLIELLIAMAIATVVGMAGVSLFSTSNWAYKTNENVAEAQQNVRIAVDAMTNDIRMAGFGLPDPPFTVTFPSPGLSLNSPITFTDGGTGGSDTITVLGGGYQVGTLTAGANAAGFNLTDATFLCYTPSAEGDKFFDGTGNSILAPYSNRKNISLNGNTYINLKPNQAMLASCAVTGIRLTLDSSARLTNDFGDGTPIFIIQAVTYSINTTKTGCTATNPCLASTDYTQLRGGVNTNDPQVVAEGIEDIQFAYGIDVSPRDGKVDYTSPYTSAAFQNGPTDPSSIIAVRAGIVAKAKSPATKGGNVYKRPATENRTASAYDKYMRRVLNKIIKLRNPRQGA